MKFKLFNREVEIEDVNYEELIVSPHTRKELENIYFDMQVIGESTNKDIQEEIRKAKDGGIFSLDNDGNKLKEYKLVKSPYSYSGNSTDENTIYSYILYLEEIERLNIESLIIGDLEVYPYEYEERYSNDAIIIKAKVELTKDISERLDDIGNNDIYFKVIRKGISEKNLEMRFGQIIWSENDEFIKKDLVFVEKIYDEIKESNLNLYEPEMGNMKNMIAYADNLNNELMNLLISKRIATSEEIELIKEKAKSDIKKTSRKFYKVKDIDKF